MNITNVLVVYGHRSPWNIRVEQMLKKQRVRYRIIQRETLKRKPIRGYDLVIALGGDGTFLRAARHIVDETPIIGINTDPATKEGYFLQDFGKRFEPLFHQLFRGKGRIIPLTRVEARISGKLIPVMALNEFFVGSEKAYLVSRYFINHGTKEEFHRSSGVIISTAAGTHAWAGSAGVAPRKLTSRALSVKVREPYTHRLSSARINNITLQPGEKITITPSRKPLVIIADSIAPEFKLATGRVLELSASKHYLRKLVI